MSQGRGWGERVLHTPDLVEAILSQLDMDLETFAGVGRVCRAWRSVCLSSHSIVIKAAAHPRLHAGHVCEWIFALSIRDAKRFATIRDPNPEGSAESFFASVLAQTGGMVGRKERLAERARSQASIERTYGPDWREIRSWRGHVWRPYVERPPKRRRSVGEPRW